MNIFFGEEGFNQLETLMENHDKVFILTDDNIDKLYPSLLASASSHKTYKIVLPHGEHNKNLDAACHIWNEMMQHEAGRDAMMINLGGGTISDIGAFAASCFKRGIDFVNVPTTLLAMVDAAIGGKNGVNFNKIKNQIGLFSEPQCVIINTDFLKSLDKRDINAALSEMMKFSFIADKSFLDIDNENYKDYIVKAAMLKDEIVSMDMKEKGMRKILNFGHTIGHAIETFYLDRYDYMRHGEAVALGIYCALFLSTRYCNLDERWLMIYEFWLRENVMFNNISDLSPERIMDIISHDKKNVAGRPRFVLVAEPERPVIDVEVGDDDIRDAVECLKMKFVSK